MLSLSVTRNKKTPDEEAIPIGSTTAVPLLSNPALLDSLAVERNYANKIIFLKACLEQGLPIINPNSAMTLKERSLSPRLTLPGGKAALLERKALAKPLPQLTTPLKNPMPSVPLSI